MDNVSTTANQAMHESGIASDRARISCVRISGLSDGLKRFTISERGAGIIGHGRRRKSTEWFQRLALLEAFGHQNSTRLPCASM
jgi:hypothetical protein